MGDDGQAAGRYAAFISYSHADRRFAAKLRRGLELYRLPSRLVGRAGRRGTVPRRLAPVFRDREELTAGEHLPEKIDAALEQSRVLVVVGSPDAAASRWVAKEIVRFRELHGGARPVLAVIAAGEPPGCFPAELAEPLAPDFRREGDGWRLAFFKLVAEIAGVELDDLLQRDAQRARRHVMAVTAGSAAALLAMGTLTALAIDARREAERQRGEAEALVEFMLTDLRDRLEGVGRLDVLTAVNRRALDYYAGQDLEDLPVDSLERRARVLHAMGEDDVSRGDLDRALAQFREARRTTAKLLSNDPTHPELIFSHAQSEFWVALVDYRRRRNPEAIAGFNAYDQLAERLAQLAPENVKYQRERAYGDGAICAVAAQPPADVPLALGRCRAALDAMADLARRHPDDAGIAADLANRHAYLADAYRQAGDLVRAMAERRNEGVILERLLAADPKNMKLKYAWIGQQRALAGLEGLQGNRSAAYRRLVRARNAVTPLVAYDDQNREWSGLRDRIDATLAYFDMPAPSTVTDQPSSRSRR